MIRFFSLLMLTLMVSSAYGQKATLTDRTDPRTTQAYCMLVERGVKVQAHLEALLSEYSSAWPQARQLRAELDALNVEMKKINEMDQPVIQKLTSGVGSLLLRKTVLLSEIKMLFEEQSSQWPPLKEKQRELELLDQEIQKILS